MNTLWSRLNTRLQVTNENLSFHLFCVVCGFFIGNIFGTFLNSLRNIFPWDGFIIVAFVFICEFISFQTYRPLPRRATEPTSFFFVAPVESSQVGYSFWLLCGRL